MDTNLIHAFGVDTLLGELYDPLLWESVLEVHWKSPDDPACQVVDALRFNLGRRLAEGETPQGEINSLHTIQRGLVDIDEWCFERVDERHLRVITCPDISPAVSMLPVSIMSMMSLDKPGQIPPQTVGMVMTLGISRPTRNQVEAVVYDGFSAPGAGQGSAHIWKRRSDGSWESTSERIAWWIS